MDWSGIVDLRHELHRTPETSGDEKRTADAVAAALSRHSPDDLIRGLGGHGVAAVFEGSRPGPTVLLRAELDALPIGEETEVEYRSTRPGTAHLCGHDGHMAMLLAQAPLLARTRPKAGRVVLLFQPAEETGQGAQQVLDDERFDGRLAPDYAFALHNLPGYPLGEVLVRSGPFATASVGMILTLAGKTSHAGQPDRGRSPALAVAQLIETYSALASLHAPYAAPALCTVVGAHVGPGAFGTSPGTGEVRLTLRAVSDELLDGLVDEARRIGTAIAESYRLRSSIELTEYFSAVVNDEACVGVVERAARKAGLAVRQIEQPFSWSEDFGRFGGRVPAALFGIGSGVDQPALHHPSYDFPDDLLKPGAAVLSGIVRELLFGQAPATED